MGRSTSRNESSPRNHAFSLCALALAVACSSNSRRDDPVDETQTTARGGQGAGGTSGLGGGTATGGKAASGGSTPPCEPEDNTLIISTGDVLTDLPSAMGFSVFDPPTSKQFTGNGAKGDVRVYLPAPVTMDRIFRTATVVDPLDRESANIELVLASGFVNARYVVDTGAELYAQATTNRTALTLCDVAFFPASDPSNLPPITVSGRVVAIAR